MGGGERAEVPGGFKVALFRLAADANPPRTEFPLMIPSLSAPSLPRLMLRARDFPELRGRSEDAASAGPAGRSGAAAATAFSSRGPGPASLGAGEGGPARTGVPSRGRGRRQARKLAPLFAKAPALALVAPDESVEKTVHRAPRVVCVRVTQPFGPSGGDDGRDQRIDAWIAASGECSGCELGGANGSDDRSWERAGSASTRCQARRGTRRP